MLLKMGKNIIVGKGVNENAFTGIDSGEDTSIEAVASKKRAKEDG